jgi:hypothetical protein
MTLTLLIAHEALETPASRASRGKGGFRLWACPSPPRESAARTVPYAKDPGALHLLPGERVAVKLGLVPLHQLAGRQRVPVCQPRREPARSHPRMPRLRLHTLYNHREAQRVSRSEGAAVNPDHRHSDMRAPEERRDKDTIDRTDEVQALLGRVRVVACTSATASKLREFGAS